MLNYQIVNYWANVVCSSSAVECRTRKRDSLGSNPLCYHFEAWAFLFSLRCPSSFGCIYIYECLTITLGGNVNE